jgi:hypothetical protein
VRSSLTTLALALLSVMALADEAHSTSACARFSGARQTGNWTPPGLSDQTTSTVSMPRGVVPFLATRCFAATRLWFADISCRPAHSPAHCRYRYRLPASSFPTTPADCKPAPRRSTLRATLDRCPADASPALPRRSYTVNALRTPGTCALTLCAYYPPPLCAP